ncbi:hypothetical protein [Kitasatospora sp. NPDC057500]|uniref:hypothetical protein n=1 Tax=Kitasatospora sp. NPDC057500 TaxID=3346151 RepID=UPI0036A35CB2
MPVPTGAVRTARLPVAPVRPAGGGCCRTGSSEHLTQGGLIEAVSSAGSTDRPQRVFTATQSPV